MFTGGEPLAWRESRKGVLELAEAHPDCFFIMYTNGTLVDDAVAKRLGGLGNVTPALSIEGMRERTVTISGLSKTWSVTGWTSRSGTARPRSRAWTRSGCSASACFRSAARSC